MRRRLPRSPLFPYTTLFRSYLHRVGAGRHRREVVLADVVGHDLARDVGRLVGERDGDAGNDAVDRKSTRLNSSHLGISYAVFCLKKKNNKLITTVKIWSSHN